MQYIWILDIINAHLTLNIQSSADFVSMLILDSVAAYIKYRSYFFILKWAQLFFVDV